MELAHKGEALFEAGTEEERRWARTACTNDLFVDKGVGVGGRAVRGREGKRGEGCEMVHIIASTFGLSMRRGDGATAAG